MRTRILVLAAILSPVLTLQAIVDTNENGLSDLWEKQHNDDELFPETFEAEADPDADGWTNAQEAAAGTDPFSTAHPLGHLQPETVHLPETWVDTDNDNIPDSLVPESIQVSWPTIPGKQYTFQSNVTLAPDNWINVGSPFIGAGTVVTYGFFTNAAAKTFWRVNIADIDSDGDNLTDAEENQIGSNTLLQDSDGDGLSDGLEVANLTNPTNTDSDGDGKEDGEDADPNEPLVNWEPTIESSYVLIDVETSSQEPFPRDLNDKGEVLFADGIWSGGNWLPKVLPAGNGNAPSNVPYEINYGPWTHFNASGKLLGRSHLRFLEGPASGGDGVGAPVFLPSNQSSPSLILDTGDVWDPFPLSYRLHGVAADGSMTIRMDPLTVGTSQIIKRFNAAGNFVGDITSTGGYEPTGSEGHGEMTASGWVASNLVRTATDTAPAVYRVGLWNTANEEKVLPTNAEGWAYPVGVADLPNEKVVLLAGKWTNDTYSGRVFLPDSAGAYQAVESLSNKKILRFAGDGTAITQDHKLWRNGKLTPLRELCQRYGELLDAEWNLHPLKANKHGSYLVQAEGPDGQIKTKILHKMGILSDTNRDGFVNQKGDEKGKSEWNTARGTIFSVNFDRDRQTQPAGGGAPTCDAITWWGQSGQPEEEDWQINSAEDVEDITPFEISTGALPSGTKVYLTAEESEDVRAIHVFPRLSGNEMAIWGGFKTEGRPWTDGDSNPLDIEITSWLRPRTGEVGYNETESGIVAGTYRFGLEGLVFRGMTVPGGTLSSGKFSGFIDLGVEVAIAGSQTRYKAGTIRMKVSPFLLTHNDRPTPRVFVADEPNGLQSMPNAHVVTDKYPNQWLQDHAEIGYTQRPGGPIIQTALLLPRDGSLPPWPLYDFLSQNKAVFALGNNLGGGGGDFGGNVELSCPMPGYPLGRVLAGSSMGETLQQFLANQEKQQPIIVNVNHTEVLHVDEMLSPGPGSLTYIPDPAGAISLLQEKFNTAEKQKDALLFSQDTLPPMVATVWRSAFSPETKFLITDLDHDTVISQWQRLLAENGGYLRLVGGTSGGQVAKIKALSKATSGDANKITGNDNPNGKLMIEVQHFYDTGSVASTNWKVNKPNRAGSWYRAPQQGARIVCVQKTLRWTEAGATPAIMSVWEVLEDANFVAFNSTTLPALIQASVTAAGIRNTTGIPSLFYKVGTDLAPTAIAYTPNAANLQWVNSSPVHPNPFGPRTADHEDALRSRIEELSPGNPEFLDSWKKFHIMEGEVHCGSNAERNPPASWWNQFSTQPEQ